MVQILNCASQNTRTAALLETFVSILLRQARPHYLILIPNVKIYSIQSPMYWQLRQRCGKSSLVEKLKVFANKVPVLKYLKLSNHQHKILQNSPKDATLARRSRRRRHVRQIWHTIKSSKSWFRSGSTLCSRLPVVLHVGLDQLVRCKSSE